MHERRRPGAPASALALLLALSGCAGFAALPEGLCAGETWQCITSTPVFSARSAVDRISNPPPPDAAARELDRRLKTAVAADRRHRVQQANGMPRDGTPPEAHYPRGHIERYARLASAAQPLDGGRISTLTGPVTGPSERHYDRKWRHARATLHLGGKVEAGKPKLFHFSSLQAVRSEIAFRSIAAKPLNITGRCEGAAQLSGGGSERHVKAGSPFRLSVPAGGTSRTVLVPAPDTRRCELEIAGAEPDRIILLRQDAAAEIDGRYHVCDGRAPGRSPLAQAFAADRWLSQSCIMAPTGIHLLADARQGFNSKVEALLGQPLPDSFIDAGDPYAPLDFSRAPKLSMIYASYLDIKADFSGKVFSRLLRYHGAQGVPIRILVTQMLQRDKDRAMLERLAADHPNIRIQEFAWRAASGAAYDELAAQLHKTNHVKLLAAISPQPGRSRAVLGGRNIHDGFLYRDSLDLSRFPELHDYRKKGFLSLNYFSNYRDFDVAIDDDSAVRTLAAHLSTLWHRDYETNVSQPFSVQRQDGGRSGPGYRHFMSVPYADGRALERYYVELIDAAQRSIEIVNPYLNPPPAIEAALRRAVQRGVDISIVARINLHGDLGGTVLTELNRLFVTKHADQIRIYEYSEPDVVLHTKLLMIDETLSVLSSVNLNHRSFIHDSENGLVIFDPDEYRRIRKIFDGYMAGSVRLDSNVNVPLFYRLLLGNDLLREAL